MSHAGPQYAYIWAFRVVAGCESRFEGLYGPEGEWVQLFRKGEGHLHTELHRDIVETRRYLTIDHWTSEEAFDTFRRAWADEFLALDEKGETLTEEEIPLGSFVSLSGT